MAFKELGGGSGAGSVLKWQTPGQVVQGRLIATKRGKVFNGRPTTLAIIKQADGVDITIPLTKVLESLFIENSLAPGVMLRITFMGKETGKNGMEYKAFKLEIDEDGKAEVPQTQQPQNVTGPTPAEIEVAKNVLESLGQPKQAPQAPVTEYDRLIGLLKQANPKGAAAIEGALATIYPDAGVRLGKLKETLQQQGVAF